VAEGPDPAAGSWHVRAIAAMRSTMADVRHQRLILAGTLIAAVAGLTACGPATNGSTLPPSAAPSVSSVASVAPTSAEAPSGAVGSPLAGQTDTDWGRIWDKLPSGFPTYPGATTSDEAASGPASATMVVGGTDAKKVASWMNEQLGSHGYAVDGSQAPLEDGSYVLVATGTAGCRAQITVAPLGGLTAITILYDAACPKP